MTENDLISRSALLEEISKCTIMPDDLYSMGIMAGVDAIKKKVENAPAVDAVEVPVRVQQIVYANLRPWEKTLNIQPFMVTCITVTQNKKGDWTKKFRANWFKDEKAVDESHDFRFDEIGKKVFLTKEEAETVLGRADDGK